MSTMMISGRGRWPWAWGQMSRHDTGHFPLAYPRVYCPETVMHTETTGHLRDQVANLWATYSTYYGRNGVIAWTTGVASCAALGHVWTGPLDFQQFSFFLSHFGAIKVRRLSLMSTSSRFCEPAAVSKISLVFVLLKKNENGISDFFRNTVYIGRMFSVILRVWPTLFRCRFVPSSRQILATPLSWTLETAVCWRLL